MRTDPALIRRAAHELVARFRGAKVRDAGLLADGRVALQLWTRGESSLLCFDVYGSPPLLTVEDGELPIAAEPGFVRALATSLRGMQLIDAQSRTGDRLLRVRFGSRSRFGVGEELLLIAELVPRFGNLILVKGEIIVAALKEFSLDDNGTRTIAAGQPYEPPPLVERSPEPSTVADDDSVLDAFKRSREERMGSGERARTLLRREALLRRLAKRERKLEDERRKLEEKRERAEARESIRAEGEAIFATLHELPEAERDQAKERATKLFAQYKKFGASLPHVRSRLDDVERALRAVDELRWEAERAEDRDLDDVERTVAQLEGRAPERNPAQRRARKRPPMEVRTALGSRILIGRSPVENAELTFHVARPNDLWFHAQNVPGAHVILQRDDRSEPPDDDVRRAAALAAFYSKAKASAKVAIDYTERKHVRAQRDAPPGLVWYTNPRTVVVEPVEA